MTPDENEYSDRDRRVRDNLWRIMLQDARDRSRSDQVELRIDSERRMGIAARTVIVVVAAVVLLYFLGVG